MANLAPNTSGLDPQAARKGELKQGTIQLTTEEWAALDKWVQTAKNSKFSYFTGRIGRADVVRGLLLALELHSLGHKVPIERLAIGEWDDEDGDCVCCGGAGYNLVTRDIDDPCPLCGARGTHLM